MLHPGSFIVTGTAIYFFPSRVMGCSDVHSLRSAILPVCSGDAPGRIMDDTPRVREYDGLHVRVQVQRIRERDEVRELYIKVEEPPCSYNRCQSWRSCGRQRLLCGWLNWRCAGSTAPGAAGYTFLTENLPYSADGCGEPEPFGALFHGEVPLHTQFSRNA